MSAPGPLPEGSERPFKSALDVVKEGRWKEMFTGADPLVMYRRTFERKRGSNSLIAGGIFVFAGLTFWYTMHKMGQDDLAAMVDERGYPKRPQA